MKSQEIKTSQTSKTLFAMLELQTSNTERRVRRESEEEKNT